MKNKKKIILIFTLCLALIPQSIVSACSGFIIGGDLTKDGYPIFGRTEDFTYNRFHPKKFVVKEAANYKKGAKLVDKPTGFTWPMPRHTYKYTATPDIHPAEGIYDESGFNEKGVAFSGTVSASPNKKILKVDPLKKDGLAESIMTTLVLQRADSARNGVKLLARVIDKKGAAEGNIAVIADSKEIWYMEILSGHQYVAIKFPKDKYAIFPNAYYLGNVNLKDKDNVIASKNVVKIAKKAKSYKTKNGKFHIALSYMEPVIPSNQSRGYAGIKLMDPDADVKINDKTFDLLRSSDKKFDIEDAFKIQRNRFEHLEAYKPSDEAPSYKRDAEGRGSVDSRDREVYKYPPGNEYVIESHIFEMRTDLPKSMGGVIWQSVGVSKSSVYLPYFGNITDTYDAYKVAGDKYDENSWYWVASNIDKMLSDYRDLFDNKTLDRWSILEKEFMEELKADIAKVTDAKMTKAELNKYATDVSKARAEKAFKEMKALEKEMMDKIEKEKGTKPVLPVDQGLFHIK